MANPLLNIVGLILSELPWYVLLCVPFWDKIGVKKITLASVILGFSFLHGLVGFLAITGFIDWRIVDTYYYYVHTLVLSGALRFCFRVHFAKLFCAGSLLMLLSTVIKLISALTVNQVPDGTNTSLAFISSHTVTVVVIIGLCFPFIYRYCKKQLYRAFNVLYIKEIWLLSLLPLLFNITRQVFVTMLGSSINTNSSIFFINILIALMGLLSFYIDLQIILNTLKQRETERKLTEQNKMLDRLNNLKTEFFQNMSHDFKTPLTVISTSVLNAADMLDFEMDKKEMRESLANAQREVMYMSRMVDNAMKYSSLQDNRYDMESLDISSLLREGAATYRPLLERRGNTLRLDIPQSLPHIFGNTDLLLHVLSNLMSNANRHTRDGEISIQASKGKGVIIVTIQDNGAGIKPEILPRVFERGISDGGTGLGLSICKTTVEAHDGTIGIESEYGQGATVFFTLPIFSNPDGEERENE